QGGPFPRARLPRRSGHRADGQDRRSRSGRIPAVDARGRLRLLVQRPEDKRDHPAAQAPRPRCGRRLGVVPGGGCRRPGGLDDRIVVRANESEATTASGLVIPDTAKEKPQQGEVLAVGPGRRAENTGELIPLDVKVGDTVVYSKYGGTEITVEGEDLLILTGRDVLAKVAKK